MATQRKRTTDRPAPSLKISVKSAGLFFAIFAAIYAYLSSQGPPAAAPLFGHQVGGPWIDARWINLIWSAAPALLPGVLELLTTRFPTILGPIKGALQDETQQDMLDMLEDIHAEICEKKPASRTAKK